MKTSQKGLDLIATFEGFRSRAYKPVPGEKYYTIGYGHYGPDVRANQVISRQEALELLRKDVGIAEATVNAAVKVPLTQSQFDALVSLTYNIGSGGFRSSSVLRLTNARRPRLAAAAFALWVRSANGTLPGLVRRRAAEARLFRTDPAKSERKRFTSWGRPLR